MGKITRTVEKEFWKCDSCGRESDWDFLNVCSKCGVETCPECQIRYEFIARRWGGDIVDLCEKGLSALYCKRCAYNLEEELVDIGFKPFSYENKPV